MFKILTLNKIAAQGIALFPKGVYETGTHFKDADALMVRSALINTEAITSSVLAIARSGAGVNNIPVEFCSEHGIIVFNTPGANANAVKELVLAALFFSSRRLLDGIRWTKTLAGSEDEISAFVENGKSQFEGPEIAGKTLGIVGLGAIGVAVANDASALGMDVIGFDPYISVDAAWNLSRLVRRADSLEQLLQKSDYVTIHVPYSEKTKHLFDEHKFLQMKRGSRLINLARGGLAKEVDVIAALNSGIIECYVTDFPTPELIAHDKVICVPHLGASTPEAEIQCAKMAAAQLINFLEYGTIKNSVNFPDCKLAQSERNRLLVANRNIPNMVGQITTELAREKINITDLINHHKENYAFNIIDTEQEIPAALIERLRCIEGVVRVRTITKQ
ncbi:MAG: 3-phosphoglycerate dehydrogenase [Spirochaetaceae bacterium]|jgi:D-3-phosphoglycerate dehydrogenase|nr:3-phosphoglycerate dehydrogenase [Spirochaetaceae bacterium]